MLHDDDRIDAAYCSYCQMVHCVTVDPARCLEARDLRLHAQGYTHEDIAIIKGEQR